MDRIYYDPATKIVRILRDGATIAHARPMLFGVGVAVFEDKGNYGLSSARERVFPIVAPPVIEIARLLVEETYKNVLTEWVDEEDGRRYSEKLPALTVMHRELAGLKKYFGERVVVEDEQDRTTKAGI